MINAANNIISVVTNLVAQMTPFVVITSNTADGTNWKLETCNTYWLTTRDTVTIGGVVFTIESFVQNSYITVSGAAQPIGTSFQIDAPVFQYGSYRKVNTERRAPTDLKAPWVYLPVPEPFESNEIDDDIAYSAPIRPLFLMAFDPNRDEIELQQTDILDPCQAMADYFLYLIEDQEENFERPEGITRKEWMNFGNSTIWGNDEVIFNGDWSGVEVRFNLDINYAAPCLCADSTNPNPCPDVTTDFNGTATAVDTAPGQNIDFQVVDAADGTTPIGTLTTNTANVKKVEVSTAGADADVELNGSNLTGLPSGQTKVMTITYANGDPLTITPVTDTALVFDGTVPNNISGIAYVRPMGTGGTIYATYDESWHVNAGTYVDATIGIKPVLDDYWNLNAGTPNAMGTFKRFTGKTGGYQNETDLLYYDIDDVLTTEALAFPDDYVICHYSGLGYPRDFTGLNTKLVDELPIINGAGYSLKGFTGDWRIACDAEVNNIYNTDVAFAGLLKAPPFMFAVAKWHTCTTFSATTYLAYTNANGSAASNANISFNSSSTLPVRTHY